MINKNLIFILVLLLFPFCSSVQIEMKQSYDLGETLIARISGNFAQPILEENIFFYRRHMSTAMPFSLSKIEGDYYIHAQIPFEKTADNYSLSIEKIKYFQGTQVIEKNLSFNFSITNKTADFFIEPAVLSTEEDFFISLQNLKEEKISVKAYLSNETDAPSGGFFSFFSKEPEKQEENYSFSLVPGETKNIYFEIDKLNSGLNLIRLKSENLEYSVRVYAFNIKEEGEKVNFYFEEPEMNLSLIVGFQKSKNISLFNPGEEDIENISLSLSNSMGSYINISTTNIEEIDSNSSERVRLDFFSSEKGYVEGFLKAEHENKTIFLPIYITSIPGYEGKNSTETNVVTGRTDTKTCLEINGTPCGGELVCAGTLINASDDRCCIGKCSEKDISEMKKAGWILLILGIIVLLWILGIKYFKTKNKIMLSKILKK